MAHAASGFVTARQLPCTARCFPAAPIDCRQPSGRAHRKGTSGCASTSSGAATSIRTSCCVMCAENRTSPQGWSGETSATKSASQPPAKAHASPRLVPCPPPDPPHTRRPPRKYNQPASARLAITSGSRPHVNHRSPNLCGLPPVKNKKKRGRGEGEKKKKKKEKK